MMPDSTHCTSPRCRFRATRVRRRHCARCSKRWRATDAPARCSRTRTPVMPTRSRFRCTAAPSSCAIARCARGRSAHKLFADAALARALSRAQRTLRPALVVAHHVEAALVAARAAECVFFAHTDLEAELPSYAHAAHAPWLARAGGALDAWLVRRAGAVAAISPALAARMRSRMHDARRQDPLRPAAVAGAGRGRRRRAQRRARRVRHRRAAGAAVRGQPGRLSRLGRRRALARRAARSAAARRHGERSRSSSAHGAARGRRCAPADPRDRLRKRRAGACTRARTSRSCRAARRRPADQTAGRAGARRAVRDHTARQRRLAARACRPHADADDAPALARAIAELLAAPARRAQMRRAGARATSRRTTATPRSWRRTTQRVRPHCHRRAPDDVNVRGHGHGFGHGFGHGHGL